MGQNISVKARLNKCGKYPQWNITKPLNVTAITTTTKKTCGTFTQWNEYYPAKKIQKKLLPFTKAWMELEGIMLGEINQAVKEKEHMISLISET